MTELSPLTAIRALLTADRATLRAAFDQIPAGLHGRRPAPDRWSAAEILEHLATIETRIVMMLGALIPTAPDRTGSASRPALDGTVAAIKDRTNRIVAPEALQPTGTIPPDASWAALERSRISLFALLDGAEHRDLSQVSRPHPVLGPLDGYQWIAAVGSHEVRHAAQLVEIADVLTR
jgi:hypothetical protein